MADAAQVTLFEADRHFGGHAHTVHVTLDGVTHGVDTGFLVFNHTTYPNLVRLFDALQVQTAASEMSFSVQVPEIGLEWSGCKLDTVFAQRRNLLSPRFLGMLRDLMRFNRITTTIAERNEEAALQHPIGDFLVERGFSSAFRDWYPRMFGVAFKPVSFWYCHRGDGALVAIVAEVNNTFGGRHNYLLAGPDLAWGRELSAAKQFHVSPCCQVEGSYRFRFMRTTDAGGDGAGRTVARIEHDDALGPLLLTSVGGELAPLTAARLRRALWRMPLLTLGVIASIHWQALRLLLKRVPFFGKGAAALPSVPAP